jgi:hypothetical protein
MKRPSPPWREEGHLPRGRLAARSRAARRGSSLLPLGRGRGTDSYYQAPNRIAYASRSILLRSKLERPKPNVAFDHAVTTEAFRGLAGYDAKEEPGLNHEPDRGDCSQLDGRVHGDLLGCFSRQVESVVNRQDQEKLHGVAIEGGLAEWE